MTHYNERLDEILRRGQDNLEIPDWWIDDTKQALTSLIKELVEEAKPNREDKAYTNPIYNSAVYEFEQNILKALEEV